MASLTPTDEPEAVSKARSRLQEHRRQAYTFVGVLVASTLAATVAIVAGRLDLALYAVSVFAAAGAAAVWFANRTRGVVRFERILEDWRVYLNDTTQLRTPSSGPFVDPRLVRLRDLRDQGHSAIAEDLYKKGVQVASWMRKLRSIHETLETLGALYRNGDAVVRLAELRSELDLRLQSLLDASEGSTAEQLHAAAASLLAWDLEDAPR